MGHMNTGFKLLTAYLILIICILFTPGCTNGENQTPDQISGVFSSEKYVVLEDKNIINGAILEGYYGGHYSHRPYVTVDYSDSKYHGSLDVGVNNESLKIFYVKKEQMNTYKELGGIDSEFGVYALPDKINDGPTVMSIGQNGTVNVTYNNQTLSLEPGDSWQYLDYTWTANESGIRPIIAMYNSKRTFKNIGVYNKTLS